MTTTTRPPRPWVALICGNIPPADWATTMLAAIDDLDHQATTDNDAVSLSSCTSQKIRQASSAPTRRRGVDGSRGES